MVIRRSAACAALLMAMMAAPVSAQDEPAAPLVQAVPDADAELMDAEILYAATCINAGMLLRRFSVEEGSEEARLLDDAIVYWDRRHAALEPDEVVRREQWVTAARLIVESGGDDAESIQPRLVVIMANCQARRAEVLRAVADPAGEAAAAAQAESGQ